MTTVAVKTTVNRQLLSFDMGLRNLAFCQLQLVPQSSQPTIVAWEVADVVGAKRNAKRMTCQRATELLLDYLRVRFPALIPNCTVLVEQQPMRARCANLKMKVLSHVLQAHFHGLGFPVRFVSPRCKLAVLGDGGSKRAPPSSSSPSSRNVYKANKRQAVGDCRTVLATGTFDRRWTQFFERLPKKDDAADCLLQALSTL